MPGQDDNHCTEVNTFRDAGEVGQKLQRVSHHRVGCEVMLHSPHAVKAGLVGDPGDVKLFKEDRSVGGVRAGWGLLSALLGLVAIPVFVVLHEYGGSYTHTAVLSISNDLERLLVQSTDFLWCHE